MRRITSPRNRGIIAVAVIAALSFAAIALTGCKGLEVPNVSNEVAVDSTGTVQAELPFEDTSTVAATSSASPTSTSKPGVPTLWPTKVATFARNFRKPVWYPKYVPAGFKIDSLDITEMGTKTGLVCDVVFLKGEKALLFTQGSPKERDYEIISAGKVAWGGAGDQADIMLQDPEDPASPPMIIFSKGGTFIELQGDPSLAELTKIAASMVPVK